MEKNDKTIIGFAGRAHNGKTMLSDYLVREWDYERLSVAHTLKKICANLLGFPSIEEMNKRKTDPKNYVLGDIDIKFLSEESGVPYTFIREELAKIGNTLNSVRHALQYIGTDIFRKFDPDWHVKQLKKEIINSPHNKIVIDDVRFINEFQMMRDLNATLIFIVRPILSNVSHHKSDEELNWKMFNGNVIINNGSEKDAICQLNWILKLGCNKTFKTTLNGYSELNLNTIDDVVTEDCSNIKVIHGLKEIIYTEKDNPLIIEDLKRKLRYGNKEEQKTGQTE